jgi:hypothetical protein
MTTCTSIDADLLALLELGASIVRVAPGGRPAQSVLPPSIHPSGRPYSWLTSPQQCSPARVTLCDFDIAAPRTSEIAFQNNS